MEQLCIGAILVLALVIIVNRVRKLFNQDCGSAARNAIAAANLLCPSLE